MTKDRILAEIVRVEGFEGRVVRPRARGRSSFQAAAKLKVMSGPWAPPTLERRADAFAAELLLPKAGIVSQLGVPTRMPAEEDLQKLMQTFGVGLTTCVNRLRDLFHVEMG